MCACFHFAYCCSDHGHEGSCLSPEAGDLAAEPKHKKSKSAAQSEPQGLQNAPTVRNFSHSDSSVVASQLLLEKQKADQKIRMPNHLLLRSCSL